MTRHYLVIALLALALAGVVPTASAAASAPDPLYPIRQFGDLAQGSQQAQGIPGAEQTQPFGAHPGLLPDWNHDGNFGNPPDVQIENSTQPATGPFRFPCIAPTGDITYRMREGRCASHGPFATGRATKLRIVDSMGWELAATLFLPREVLGRRAHKVPGVVIADGAQASAQTFYMYSMTLADQGLMVLNFDFAGQGQSEDGGAGFVNDFFADAGSVGGGCQAPRSCRETQDMVRWFTGATITRVATSNPGSHHPAYTPRGDNIRNPALSLLDTKRVGLIGQSMGGLTVSNYLWHLPTGKGADGRPLPPLRAAIGLSGFAAASAVVPYQLQTADLDIPGRDSSNFIGTTDGPAGTKAYYDDLRARGKGGGALELIVLESGSHGDTSNSTRFNGVGTPHAVWSWALSTAYAADWMGCYLQSRSASCTAAVSPRPHLSRAQASEYDGDGPGGPAPSRCITIPDKATLEQAWYPDRFAAGVAGQPQYDCQKGGR